LNHRRQTNKSNTLFCFRVMTFAIFAIAATSCSQSEVGTKDRPFTMYFVPSVDAEQITTTADTMTKFIQKHVSQTLYGKDQGFYVSSAVPASYIAVVEAFGTKKADFAAFNTFSYILAKDIKKYDVDVIFSVLRGEGERFYKGQIIAREGSGIKSIKDLQGKKFAYTDPASTSGFILPSSILKKAGVKPSQIVFANKHDNVVSMIYQGQVDAGATFYSPPDEAGIRDARARVKTQFPDVEDKVKIIGFTEEIPNDPWVIRGNLYKDPARNEEVKSAIKEAISAYTKTDDGISTLKNIYSVTGISEANDKIYDSLRSIMKTANLDVESIMRKK